MDLRRRARCDFIFKRALIACEGSRAPKAPSCPPLPGGSISPLGPAGDHTPLADGPSRPPSHRGREMTTALGREVGTPPSPVLDKPEVLGRQLPTCHMGLRPGVVSLSPCPPSPGYPRARGAVLPLQGHFVRCGRGAGSSPGSRRAQGHAGWWLSGSETATSQRLVSVPPERVWNKFQSWLAA